MDEVIEIAKLRDLERANAGYARYVSTLFEAHEVVQFWQGLSRLPAELFKERLRQSVSGPTWYSEEESGTSSNLARNIAFELLVTAQCATSGLTIEEERLADVSASTSKYSFLIECKRPQSLKSLPNIMKGARRQLMKRLKDPSQSRSHGVIALDLTKLTNPRFGVLNVPSSHHARNFVERCVAEFIDTHHTSLNLARSTRVVGSLIRVSVIAECQDMNSLMYCQQWGLAELPDLGLRERQAFSELSSHLGAVKPSWSREDV